MSTKSSFSPAHVICALSLVALLVVLVWKCPKGKEGFRAPEIPSSAFREFVDAKEVPLSPDFNPVIGELNGSYFRGFADLVSSPSLPEQRKESFAEYMTPDQMLPKNTMDRGMQYREDGSIPNEGNIIAINLSRNRFQTDCVTATFNQGSDDIEPVNSVHRDFTDAIHSHIHHPDRQAPKVTGLVRV